MTDKIVCEKSIAWHFLKAWPYFSLTQICSKIAKLLTKLESWTKLKKKRDKNWKLKVGNLENRKIE